MDELAWQFTKNPIVMLESLTPTLVDDDSLSLLALVLESEMRENFKHLSFLPLVNRYDVALIRCLQVISNVVPEYHSTIANLVRDIIGNPYFPIEKITLQTGLYGQLSLLHTLATNAYEQCQHRNTLDPIRLSILADALEEAGAEVQECEGCDGTGMRWYCKTCRSNWKFPEARSNLLNCLFCNSNKCNRQVCNYCQGVGVNPYTIIGHLRSPLPHVRGCWALDLILGRARYQKITQ